MERCVVLTLFLSEMHSADTGRGQLQWEGGSCPFLLLEDSQSKELT